MHVVAVHARDEVIAYIIHHNVASERSHGQLIGVSRPRTQGGDCAPLTPNQIILELHMILSPQIMHEECAFLGCGAE